MNEITHMHILTGPPPATLYDHDPGVVLATVPILSASLGAASSGMRILFEFPSQVEVQTGGIAEHFRIETDSEKCALLGHVSETWGTGNLRLNNTWLTAGDIISWGYFELVAPGLLKPEAPASAEEKASAYDFYDEDDY